MAKDDLQDPSSQNPESSDAEVEQAAQGSDLRRPPILVGFLQLLILVALGWIGWQWVTWPKVKDLVDNNPETTAFIELYRDGGSRSENRTVDWRWSSPELCVKVRGSSSMLLLGCLGDLLRFEKREIQVATFAPDRSSP